MKDLRRALPGFSDIYPLTAYEMNDVVEILSSQADIIEPRDVRLQSFISVTQSKTRC